GKQVTVRSESKLNRIAFSVTQLRQIANEFDKTIAQQRLAPGQSNLPDTQSGEDPRHSQIVRERQVAIEGAFVPGAAVDALVVATICDRNPQIRDLAAEFIG